MSTSAGLESDPRPSSAPVFRKRGARPKADTGIKSFTLDDSGTTDANQRTIEKQLSDLAQEDTQENEEEARISVEDLVALRALRNKPQGIDLDRLNKGDSKKKKKSSKKQDEKPKQQTEEDRWAEQMQRGGLVTRDTPKSGTHGTATEEDDDGDDDGDDSDEEGAAQKSVPRLVKQNNFQGETGTVDVDKHMMAYIEEQMQKRRRGEAADADVLAAAQANGGRDSSLKSTDDELYSIAEKYQQIQRSAKDAIALAKSRINAGPSDAAVGATSSSIANDQEKEEGSASLSTSMLTSVPEIDLGIEVRMRNIEATERAKRAMEEAQRSRSDQPAMADETDFAAARFFRYAQREASDAERHRLEAGLSEFTEPMAAAHDLGSGRGVDHRKRQTATDDATLERFKKRQRSQLKR